MRQSKTTKKPTNRYKYELTADMIGGPEDDLTRPEPETSTCRESNVRAGYIAGYHSAADDYVAGLSQVERSKEALRKERDLTDHYSVGFELGYLHKLADILVG